MLVVAGVAAALALSGCGGRNEAPPAATNAPEVSSPPSSGDVVGTATSTTAAGPVELAVTEVATGLDTVWALAWDSKDRLWFTERGGRLRRLGGPTIEIDGVVAQGESGLMGLEIDPADNVYLVYTTRDDNRVVRRDQSGGKEAVLVSGIAKAPIHDGGRLRFGPDGLLYATTGDAGVPDRSQDDASPNGKVLTVDPASGARTVFAKGLRNTQGLCFASDGRLFSTEHGPDRGDEINLLRKGFDGGWPDRTGNGIKNWTPTIAPAGCAVYESALIPQWQGSLLLVTLKQKDLRRLTVDATGRVTGEEVLFDDEFGRLRDVRVGPDGAVYLATSNKDGRGSPARADDRILRIAPVGR